MTINNYEELIDLAKALGAMAKEADMVCVVRCKDCKKYRSAYCTMFETFDNGTNPEDFCSYAENTCENTCDFKRMSHAKEDEALQQGCPEKQINMAIGAITHMLTRGYYSEDMEDALNLAIKVLVETELSCSEEPNRSDTIYRQDAIDAVKSYFTFSPLEGRQCAKALERVPSAQPLTETDLLELEHRFGEFVRFVVEDMLSGEEKRWEKKN